MQWERCTKKPGKPVIYPKPATVLWKKKRSVQTWEISLRLSHGLRGTTCLPLQHSLLKYSSHLKWLSNAHEEARGWCWVPPSTAFHLVFLRQGLFLNPELTNWLSWLASRLHGSACLFSQCCDYRHALLHLASGDLNGGPHACPACTSPTKPSPCHPFHYKIFNKKVLCILQLLAALSTSFLTSSFVPGPAS